MRALFAPAEGPPWLWPLLTSIRAALSDIWPGPVRLKDYATADFPLAADWKQGLAYDSTLNLPKYSNGIAWSPLLDEVLPENHGAVGDGVTDDTTAIQAAITAAASTLRRVRFSAKTYLVSSLTVPTDVVIGTAGHDTVLKQKTGTAVGTRVLVVTGSNVRIDDISIEGNISTDTDEQNHGVFVQANATVGSLSNIEIGNVKGTNIRGDVVYIGTTTGYTLSQVKVGHVLGVNILRNVVSVVGGTAIDIASITGSGGNGYMIFDIEPNAGSGGVIGCRIGYAKGRYAGCVSPAVADICSGIEIGTLDLDPSYNTDSTPSYAAGTSQQHAFQIRNTRDVRIGTFLANGHNGQAIRQVYNGGELAQQAIRIGYARITGCCLTEVVSNSFIEGAAGVTLLHIGTLVATTTLATHRVVQNCSYHRIETAVLSMLTGSNYVRSCSDGVTNRAVMTTNGAGNGGLFFNAATRCSVLGGSIVGDRLLSNCTACVAENVVSTMVTGHVVGSVSNNTIRKSTLGGTYYELLFYQSSTTITLQIDASGNVLHNQAGSFQITGAGFFNVGATGNYRVGNTQVVKARITGWGAMTGTAARTAAAVHAAQVISNPPTQAEVQNIDNSLVIVAQRLKALIDDLHGTAGHGLIGA